jgi:hypothetical protein
MSMWKPRVGKGSRRRATPTPPTAEARIAELEHQVRQLTGAVQAIGRRFEEMACADPRLLACVRAAVLTYDMTALRR